MKVVFLGTPSFAQTILEAIDKSHHEVVAVVCQPSKEVGRGKKVQDPPTKEYAIRHGIPVYQFQKISREGVDVLKALNADVMVTAAYGQILSKDILEITPHGVLNVHGSLLPKYRGSSPIQWAIINGETKTGITIMKTNVGIDDGDILLSQDCEISSEDTDVTLFEKLAIIGADLIIKALDDEQSGKARYLKQGNEFSYFPMIKKEMAHIDFSKTGEQINNLVRGLNSWPTAFCALGTSIFKIFKTKAVEGQKSGAYGEVVVSSSKQGLVVKCGDGLLEIIELQAENGKRMRAKEYLNGKKIEIGEIFS